MTKSLLPDPSVLGGCVYYSQNREDLVLLSFFPDVQKGFYVDVGAFDPDYDSVTKLFYQLGWHGINIEPQPERYQAFQKIRRRDTNLNVGIADKNGQLTLRAYKSGGLSTFSDVVKQNYEQAPDADTESYTEHTVAVRPLREVFAEQKVTHIDFMKVDVEGLEYDVLASNDWQRYRPEVLCIEANHVQRDWHSLLKKAGYELVFDDGLNEYFTDNRTKRCQKFNYVKDVINDRGGGLRADHFDLMMQLYRVARDKTQHVETLAKENERLTAVLKDYEARLAAYAQQASSIKHTTKQLARLVKRNVIRSK